MKSRSQRRHDRRRMYNRAVRMISIWESDSEHLQWRARRIFNNMKNCSCSMCCNERSNGWYSGKDSLTRPEQRSLINFREQIEEI